MNPPWTLIAERLDPLGSWNPAALAEQSDFDLNPDLRPTAPRVLKDAAVLVPVVDHEDGPTLLLTRRTDHLTKHAGQIAFPGGRLDPGEGVMEAALREAEEEIALDRRFVEPLALSAPYETVTGYRVVPVIARVRPGFALQASPEEVAEAFEAPWAFFMDPANHERRFFETGGVRRWYWAMPYGDRFVWGATAGMLRALWSRLYGDAAEAGLHSDARSRSEAR